MVIDVHGGDIWRLARRYGLDVENIIDFSASINPVGLPSGVKDVILRSIENILHYPDPDYAALREKLALYLSIDTDSVIVGNGSTDLIFLISMVILPKRTLIPIPSFSEYERGARLSGSEVVYLKSEEDSNFRISQESIIDNLRDIDMLYLGNPNNPTGMIVYRKELEGIINACERDGVFVVLDEAFIEFVDNFEDLTFIRDASVSGNLLVIRSLTKSFALPGLRVGYAVGKKGLIRRLRDLQPAWSVNSFAEAVGREVLNDTNYIEHTKRIIKEEKGFLIKGLKEIKGIEPLQSKANFLFIRITDPGFTSTDIRDMLLQRSILVRDLSTMSGLNNRYFRCAVRRRNENRNLLKALKEIFGG